MFPKRGEALDHTIRVEAAVSDLYAEALRRWAPSAAASILPNLLVDKDPVLIASTLPPDPEAMAQAQSVWDQHAEEIVLAGLAVLWAVAAYEAAKQFGEIPDAVTPDVSTVVVGIVLASLLMPKREVQAAVGYVESMPALVAARDDFLAVKRVEVARTPLAVQAKVELALNAPDLLTMAAPSATTDFPAPPDSPLPSPDRSADEPSPAPQLTVSVIPEDRPEILRERAAEVMEPASPEMRDIARHEGYQAASVLNHAIVAAAVANNVDGEDLQKAWICVHPDTVVSASGVTHLARRRYKGPLVSVRAASGATVALTPEHRVLTGRGWLAAKFLNEGDSLFKVRGTDSTGAPQVQDSPALIGQVVDAAMNDRPAEVRTVRHGVDLDGDVGSGYVDVVAAVGDLSINLESSGSEALRDLLLTDADLLGHAAVLRGSGLPHCWCGFDSAPVLGGDALVELGLNVVGDLGSAQNTSGGFIPHVDARAPQNVNDLHRAAAVSVAERVSGLTSHVGRDNGVAVLDEIVTVPCRDGELLCGSNLSDAFRCSGPQLDRFGNTAQDSAVSQSSANRLGASPKVGSDGDGCFSGEVSADDFIGIELDPFGALLTDRVVGIELIAHDGFVYDLSTFGHWYLAGDLVVHNCTLDGKTRPTHWASDGARVPIAGTFTVGAAQLAFPGDPAGPPEEVKNCRCRLGILAADEELPDEVDRHTERLDGRDSVAIRRDGRTQAEEIRRRADDGNIRARDDPEGQGRVASGGWTATSEQEITMTTKTTKLAADAAATDDETYLTFTDALFAVTGVPTSDGRMLSGEIDLAMRSTPLPLQWCEEIEGGHYGSVTVGVIEAIRFKDGEVRADGYMLNNENALKAIDLVSHGVCNPSVDLGNCRIIASDEKGNEVTAETYVEGMTVYETVTEAEVMATTIVAIPAFGQTRIALNEQREPRAKALVASATATFAPRVYDPALFADPKLSGPTHLGMSEDGHIFGHVACWKEQHRSVGLGNINPPRSKTGYENFHSSPPVRLADGTSLPVGRLTVGIGHAPTRGVSNAAAQAHYDNAESCFAMVRAGEDEHGIWVSGVPAPWASPEKVEMGLSAPLSGDWRPYNNQLDLVAVLAVNTPGFLCRTATDSRGAPVSLVASFSPPPQIEAGGISHLSADDIRAIVTEGVLEAHRRAALADHARQVFDEARELVGPPPPVLTVAEEMDELLADVP